MLARIPYVLAVVSPLALAAEQPSDHFWIQAEPGYVARNGSHCCGRDHCRQVADDFAFPVEGGWQIRATGQILRWGERGLYPNAKDGVTLWACVWGGETQCLFAPGRGT